MSGEHKRKDAAEDEAGGRVVPIGSDLTTRVGSILEAVQREADRIIEQARAEARSAQATPRGAPPAVGEPAAPLPGISPETHRAAVQMASLGCTRAQVDSHLRGYLHVAEPTALLDRIFGVGTDAETRVPWAQPPG